MRLLNHIFRGLPGQSLSKSSVTFLPAQQLHTPWQGEAVIRVCGSGSNIRYPGCGYSSVKIQWVSTDAQGSETIRTPKPADETYRVWGGFQAAGKHYRSLEQLFVQADPTKTWCRDVYGREVLYLVDRFPCFDSYDYLHEDRFFRWFFLREGNKLTRIQYTDESDTIYVTEDVAELESSRWDDMKRLKYFP